MRDDQPDRFEAQAEVSEELLDLLFGGSKMPGVGGHSLTFDRPVPGGPTPPVYRTGWWDRLTGVNRRLRRDYEARYAAWDAAGRPDAMLRTYIPRAEINQGDDGQSFTATVQGPQ